MTDANAIGRFLRKLRDSRGEILRDMAEKLDVSESYLWAVEMGNRVFPDKWAVEITRLYNLDFEQKKAFKLAILDVADSYRLDIKELDIPRREVAYVFVRRFKDLDDSAVAQIWGLLKDIETP